MPSPFMGTVTGGHITLADFPLTRTNLMPTDLCYNLILQGKLEDAVSREMTEWPCSR